MKPRLLIVGGGHGDIPMINAAKRLGFYVITSGNRRHDLGHSYSDEVCLADFSDPEVIYLLARDLKVSAICPACNDFSALSSAYAAEKLGLPGHDPYKTAEVLHHKDSYRQFAHANGIPAPKALGFSSAEAALDALKEFRLPVLVKPVDLTGGKGISKVADIQHAATALQNAFAISKAKRIVIEEFIEGSRHGFSAILRDRKVHFYFTDDEHYHLSPYLVSGASAPTTSSEASVARIIEYSEFIASKLYLTDGIFHVQFIQPESGDPVIIEICRRPPGDLYVELVRHATGAPYAEWIIRAAAGMDLSQLKQMPVQRHITRHCLMSEKPGVFSGFNFDPETKAAIIDQLIWGKIGDEVLDPMTHKFGIVFVEHQDLAQIRSQALHLQQLLTARILTA